MIYSDENERRTESVRSMETVANDGGRTGDTEDQGSEQKSSKKSLKDWNNEKAARTPGPNERYDPTNDIYISKGAKRYIVHIEVNGINPEITESFFQKISKNFRQEYPDFSVPGSRVPVAIRFRLSYSFPGSRQRALYAEKGFYYPSGVDLRAWADFLFNGFSGLLFETPEQIVCTGCECVFAAVPGIQIDFFCLWDMVDKKDPGNTFKIVSAGRKAGHSTNIP